MPTRFLTLEVSPDASHQRLDHFLASHIPEASRSRIQELIRAGEARVNGRVVRRPSSRLRGGERVEFALHQRPPLAVAPEAIPLTILYEDKDIVAVNKPAGLPVHIGAGRSEGTVVNALLHHFTELSALGGPLRPGIVHRLDKPTSGVLLVAKNDEAHSRLTGQFRRRQVEKHYLALVHGRVRRAHDVIRLPVARDVVRRTRMTTRRGGGREAVTEYRVVGRVSELTLLRVVLHTGRTHQIRVHLAALGHPLVGDTTYGAPRKVRGEETAGLSLGRVFLHACRIRFFHPRSQEPLDVKAPLPAELEDFLRSLGWQGPIPN